MKFLSLGSVWPTDFVIPSIGHLLQILLGVLKDNLHINRESCKEFWYVDFWPSRARRNVVVDWHNRICWMPLVSQPCRMTTHPCSVSWAWSFLHLLSWKVACRERLVFVPQVLPFANYFRPSSHIYWLVILCRGLSVSVFTALNLILR